MKAHVVTALLMLAALGLFIYWTASGNLVFGWFAIMVLLLALLSLSSWER